MRVKLAIAVAVGALLWGVACRVFSGRDANTLSLAVRADVTGFFPNPPFTTESYTLYVNHSVFEGLLRFDRQHNPTPAVADRWEMPDERTWVFHLHPGLRFSDGQGVTADDVVASLLTPRKKGWQNAGDVSAVESVRALGTDSVEIRTKTPYPALLYRLPWGFVLPARSMNQAPVPTIGTGPYRLDSWQPGRELVLLRNDRFRGPLAPFERVRFTVVADAKERVRRVMEGEADLADDVPYSAIDAITKSGKANVVVGPGSRVLFLAMRTAEPPFSDPRVREALDLAVDRHELIRNALFGKALPASQLVSPAVAGYNPALPHTSTDRDKSRRLLAEAGYPDGFSVRLDGPNNRYANDSDILREVARQLGLVGVTVEVNAQPKGEFYRLIAEGKSRFYLFGWACELGDAGEALDEMIHSRTSGALGRNNFQGFADAELDRLIEKAGTTALAPERNALLAEALARVAALRPVLPLEIQTEAFALSRRVTWEPPLNMALEISEIMPAGRGGAHTAAAQP